MQRMLRRMVTAFLIGGVIALLAGAFLGDSVSAPLVDAGGIALIGAVVYYGYAAPLRAEQRHRSLRT